MHERIAGIIISQHRYPLAGNVIDNAVQRKTGESIRKGYDDAQGGVSPISQDHERNAESLTVDDIPISIGLSKAEALAKLSGYNIGTPMANGRSIISSPSGANHFRIPGTIAFNNGVVTELSRNWGDGEQSPEVERLWKSFWGAVTSTVSVGQNYVPLSMRAYAGSFPARQSQTIDILVAANHVVSTQRVELLNPSRIIISPLSGPVWSVSVDETVF